MARRRPAIWPAGQEVELDRDRAAAQPGTPAPTIVDAIRGGVLDTELAGLLWLLLDGGVPLVVAGPGDDLVARASRAAILGAILDLAPAERIALPLAGPTEDFTWLASAETLGWRRTAQADPEPAVPATTLIVAGELGAGPSADTTGDAARVVVRALGQGFGLAATAQAARLEDLLEEFRRRPIRLSDDELSVLGVVAILEPRDVRPAPGSATPGRPAGGATVGPSLPRLGAVHYLRPLARDVHGHPQRLPPAVLATWDGRIARFEHFAWGIAAELAARVGRRTGDFEREAERRTSVLTALSAADPDRAPVGDRTELRRSLDRARLAPQPPDRADH